MRFVFSINLILLFLVVIGCTDLLSLVDVLENCEAFATERTKRLHSSVLNHVEQIMDLNKHIKNKEKINEDLNNGIFFIYNFSTYCIPISHFYLIKYHW